jgi:hypothetical protein
MLDRSEHADFTGVAKPILRGVFPYSRQPTESALEIAAKTAASCDRAGRADPRSWRDPEDQKHVCELMCSPRSRGKIGNNSCVVECQMYAVPFCFVSVGRGGGALLTPWSMAKRSI